MVAVIESAGPPGQADFHAAIASRSDRWYSACLRITRSPELAEDAVQEALMSAWAKRDQFNHTAKLETWIHRIAVNAALQLLRKNRPGMFESLEFEVLDPAETPEEAQRNRELDDDLAAAFSHLSDIERVCFVLKHQEQWRLKEIAEAFSINVGTVKQAVFRGVRKLRVHMIDLKGIDND